MHHSSRSEPSRLLLYTLILLPMLAFYSVFLLRYGRTYLLRRDENIMLALIAELQHGRDIRDIFTMVITPSFLAVILWFARFADVLLLGRLLSMVSALSCALLSARIAQRLFPRASVVPSLTLALVCSSALFVQEGTIFRLDIVSLAFSLGGIAVLVSIDSADHSNIQWRVWLAGVLFGIALQVKPLMLVIVPCVFYLLWKIAMPSRDLPDRTRRMLTTAGWHALGWIVPAALVIGLFGWNGMNVGDQLGKHFGAAHQLDLASRVGHSIAVSLEFVQNHFWIVLFFIVNIYSAWRTRGSFVEARIAQENSVCLGSNDVHYFVHQLSYLGSSLCVSAATVNNWRSAVAC